MAEKTKGDEVVDEALAEREKLLADLAEAVAGTGGKFVLPDGTEITGIAAVPDERTIYERMVAILDELPAIGKDQRNEQQNFMYRGHDDVMAALNPLLGKHGVFLTPRVLKRVQSERKTSSGKAMYEVDLHVEFTFTGLRGDSVVASAWGEGTDLGDKSTNKATTGAFKNVLAIVFAISTHELSDADAGTPEETVGRGKAPGGRQGRAQKPKTFDPGKDAHPNAVTGEALLELLNAIGPTIDWPATVGPLVLAHFGVGRDDLTDEQKPEYLRRLANAAAKISEEDDVTTFPPIESTNPALIKAALAWAFRVSDTVVELVEVLPTEEILEGAEVPWVDDVKEALDAAAAREAADRDPDPTDDAADAAGEETTT